VVQIGSGRFVARAREATGEERVILWREMAARVPLIEDYQRRASRQIPLVVLERADRPDRDRVETQLRG
jgi:hypothetical protein